jgi:peptide/nickel transport system permease protein
MLKIACRIVAPIRLIVSGAILTSFAAMAFRGAMLAPEAYLGMSPAARFAGPDLVHWLGRDELGRDTFGRLLVGTTTTMSAALMIAIIAWCGGLLLDRMRRASSRIAIALAAVISPLVRVCFIAPAFLLGGTLAGNVAMAVLSAVLLLPGLLAVITIVAYLSPGPVSCIVALGLLFAVAAAYVLEATHRPSLRLPLVLFAWAILSVSALDAAGLGTKPPTPSWGAMLGSLSGPQSLHATVMLAGACLLLAAGAAIMLGDALGEPKIQSIAD